MGESLPDGNIQGYVTRCGCGATADVNIQGSGTCPACDATLPDREVLSDQSSPMRPGESIAEFNLRLVREEWIRPYREERDECCRLLNEAAVERDRLREAIRVIGSAWRGGNDVNIADAIQAATDLAGYSEQEAS